MYFAKFREILVGKSMHEPSAYTSCSRPLELKRKLSKIGKSKIYRLQNALKSLVRRSPNFVPNFTYKTVRQPISTLNTPYCQHNSLLLVSKLKPTSLCYLLYLNAFPGIIVPVKKPMKKPIKQALKLTLVILTPLVAFLASSTCFISNTHARLRTTSVAAKAFAVNKCRKPSTPPLGPPKPGQYTKLTKIT